MGKLAQWINRKERQQIKRLKAELRTERELRKMAEKLAYKSILAIFDQEEESAPVSSAPLS